jgi:transcriptional regulator with XRE-family HTH domain
MILKKLRENRKWSQEQLAKMAGLSVRTIQRIEAGHSASIETLKALASVLEVNISTLEQEITMIDKTSEKWQSLPLLFRLNFVGSEVSWLGLSQRKYWLRAEKLSAIAGLVLCSLVVVHKDFFAAGLFMIVCAYGLSLVTRMGDEYAIW